MLFAFLRFGYGAACTRLLPYVRSGAQKHAVLGVPKRAAGLVRNVSYVPYHCGLCEPKRAQLNAHYAVDAAADKFQAILRASGRQGTSGVSRGDRQGS